MKTYEEILKEMELTLQEMSQAILDSPNLPMGQAIAKAQYDKILNHKIEGGVCPECKGAGGYWADDRVRSITTTDCPHCKGNGFIPDTTPGSILKDWIANNREAG